jgi:hypothetical protein
MTMTWNLRMAAAQRDVWKASQLHAIARRRPGRGCEAFHQQLSRSEPA